MTSLVIRSTYGALHIETELESRNGAILVRPSVVNVSYYQRQLHSLTWRTRQLFFVNLRRSLVCSVCLCVFFFSCLLHNGEGCVVLLVKFIFSKVDNSSVLTVMFTCVQQ